MGLPKGSAIAEEPLLRLQMFKDMESTDEIVVRMSSTASDKSVYNEDAVDMGGIAPPVSLSAMSADSVKLAIDLVSYPTKRKAEVVPLYVDAAASGAYKLNLNQVSYLQPSYQVMLRDLALKDSLIMQQGSSYSFNIDKGDSSTFAGGRFQLVITHIQVKEPKVLTFNADKAPAGSLLTWKAKDERNTTTFYAERSTDKGQSFQPVGSLQSNNSGNYDLVDKAPLIGENQYRLKLLDFSNNITYSNIAKLYYQTAPNNSVNIRVFPNPTTSAINLSMQQEDNRLSNFRIESYDIRIVNSFGMVVKTAVAKQSDWKGNVGDLQPGTYRVQVTNRSNNSLVGIASFVKD